MARSSNTRQKTAKADTPQALSGTDAFDSPALPALTGDALPPEALAQVLTAEDIYISPQTLAAMTGLDEKWFAGAREGHKEIDGPPFRKLGTAKSAPVRYNLADVRKWWAQFPKQVTTHGKLSAFRSAGEFFKAASPSSRWLFANVAGEPVDIVLALQGGVFGQATQEPEVFWLSFPEWIARAWQSERLIAKSRRGCGRCKKPRLQTTSSGRSRSRFGKPRQSSRRDLTIHEVRRRAKSRLCFGILNYGRGCDWRRHLLTGEAAGQLYRREVQLPCRD